MNLGEDIQSQVLFNDLDLASSLKTYLSEMDSSFWELDTHRQTLYDGVHGDTKSIIYRMTNTEGDIGETTVSTPTPSHITDKVYEVVDMMIKAKGNDRGNDHGTRTRVLRLMLVKLIPGGEIAPHQDYNNLLLSNRIHFVVKNNSNCIFKIGDTESNLTEYNFIEGECFELNNSKVHAVKNDGEEDRIHLICDILFEGDPSLSTISTRL